MTVERGHDTVAWSESGKQVLWYKKNQKSQSSHVIVATKHVAYIIASEAAVKSYLEKLNLYKIVSVNK